MKIGKGSDKWLRRLAAPIGFLLPFGIAAVALVYGTAGQAQTTNNLPGLLQQMQGSSPLGQGLPGLGGFNSGVGQQPDMSSQTYLPQFRPAPLPPSRLEQIMSSRAGIRLQQFGYDQLGSGRSVTIAQTGAVQDDYILGPGDQIVVSLRGQENSDFRAAIDRSGQVLLPRLKPISAIGRSFSSFRQDLEAAVRRAYVATEATVSVATVRQIRVLVSGEVNNPGQRTLSGLSSAVDALLLSGGVRKTGSLRNIRIQRSGREYNVDLYSVLTSRGGGADLRLTDGDRVVVPPLGPTVAVAGLVRRPGIYELPARATSVTARMLLAQAGGQEVRGRYRLSVQRIEADGRLHLAPLQNENGVVRDSEILRVELGADQVGAQATLSGGIGLSGQYPITSGTRLSDVVKAPGALGTAPYTLFGIIVRKDPRTMLRTLTAFTPVAVLSGTEDQQLQTDDVIRPISVDEAQMLTFVLKTYLAKLSYDQARIRNPLEASRADSAAAAQAAVVPPNGSNSAASVQALMTPAITPENPFGLPPGTLDAYSSGQEDFSSVPADIQRNNIIALLDLAAPGTPLAQQRQLAYQQSLSTSKPSGSGGQSPEQLAQAQRAALMASQGGAAFAQGLQQQGYGQMLNGLDAQAGQIDYGLENGYPSQNPRPEAAAPNYQDQAANSGGFPANREAQTFGELSRQLGVDPLVLVNFLIDHRARLDGAVRGPGSYFVGPNVSLNDLVQAAGGTANWADESGVELLTTAVDNNGGRSVSQRQPLPLRQGTLVSYTVRPRDQLHFNKVFTDVGVGAVTVQGEVRFAGSYPITRGERLSDVLARAGGLTGTAYPAGTVFLRRSAAQVEQDGYNRAANEIQSQLLAGMARIGNDKIPVEAFTAMQSFVTQLRTQKALGRVAIAADPSVLAANPSLDPLLEAGDVVFIPQRPSTIAVLGEVMQPGSYAYKPGATVGDYVRRAGGYAQFSNEDMTFIVQPDGSARRIETSWLNFDVATLPPGSAIVVPRDLAPLNARQIILDVTGIMSSLAVTIASLAVLAKQ